MRQEYSSQIMDHFENPRNAGHLSDANGAGTAGGHACSDTLTIWINVVDDTIERISFKCSGCPTAIACGSVTTELAIGKTLDEAAEIADDTISMALGGLPADKRHCSNLGAEALSNAIMSYVTGYVAENTNPFVKED